MSVTDDFSEDFYLRAYPDVVGAVRRGDFASGLHHYEVCGRSEGRMGNNTKPVIFFVHVPKTAGSAVNDALTEAMPNGLAHWEPTTRGDDTMAPAVLTSDWLSGHLYQDVAEEMLTNTTSRRIRFFSCMRDPTRQVMSHYNWLIEIFHLGRQFYEGHSARIKAISEEIRSSATDPASIVANLNAFADLFLNAQSAYILGRQRKLEVLDRYEAVTADDPAELLSSILGRPVDHRRRVNVSRYHFNPAVFDTDELQSFLAEHNFEDETLYRRVKATQLLGSRAGWER